MHGPGQGGSCQRGIDTAGRPGFQHDLIETRFALRTECATPGIPAHHFLGDETFAEFRTQALFVHRRATLDQGIARFMAQLTDHDPRLTKQGAVIEQTRRAAIGQLVATRILGMLGADAIRESMHQHVTQSMRFDAGRWTGVGAQAATPLLGCRIDRSQSGAIGLRRHTAIAKSRQCTPARRECIAPLAQGIARFHQSSEITGQRTIHLVTCAQQHRRQARMRAQCEHAFAQRSDGVGGSQRTQATQQVACGTQRTGGRRIDEAQLVTAPRGEFQCERGQFHQRHFRPALWIKPLRLRPQAIGPAFGDAASAAGALVSGSLRDVRHFQPRETTVRVIRRLTRQATVDDHAHAGQGDTGFGHVGGQHHAAAALRIGLQGFGLFLDGKFAVQRQHDDIPCRNLLQHGFHTHDLPLPRQEHQHVTRMLGQPHFHRAPRLYFQ